MATKPPVYKVGQRVYANIEESRLSLKLTKVRIEAILRVGICDVKVLEGPRKGEKLRIDMEQIMQTSKFRRGCREDDGMLK